MLKLKMYPANNGDAFLVHASGSHVLVDAGYASTFNEHIKPDLLHLAGSGEQLDLLICTHIDEDHIGGILEFVSSNGISGARRIVDVKQVWHNSLRSLPSTSGASDTAADCQVLEAIRRRGFPLPAAATPAANPISARQGSSLATLLKQNGYLWNEGDGTTAVAVGMPVHELQSNVAVRLIGPSPARLQELRAWWLIEMRKLAYRGGAAIDHMVEDAYEMLCASARQPTPATAKTISTGGSRALSDVYVPDESPTNGSSIATIIESDGKRLLLLGDAWAEDVAAELRRLQRGAAVQIFDAIKVSHHGSNHNTSVDLLTLIDSPIFLISSSGSKHHHPHFEVLAEIVDRPAAFKRTIYFNYETPASTRLRAHTSKSGAKFDVAVVQNGWIHI